MQVANRWSAPAVPLVAQVPQVPQVPQEAQPEATSWQWSKGKEPGGSQERSRAEDCRHLRRSRSRRRESGRHRSRSREVDRDRTQVRVSSPSRKLGGTIETQKRGFRATCNFPVGDGKKIINSVGPWRKSHEMARNDVDALEAAYAEGGDSKVQLVKRSLFLNHLADDEKVVSGGDANEAAQSDALAGDSSLELRWPTEIEGPSTSTSSLGGYRAACSFPSTKALSYDGAKPRRPITVKGPWRLGCDGRLAAEADAVALCDAFENGSTDGMTAKKGELFRYAEEKAQAARKPCTTFVTEEASGIDPAPVSGDRVGDVIEEDSKKGRDSRGFRALCTFCVPRKSPTGEGMYPVELTGVWRKRRRDADADIQDLRRAFDEGGLSKANCRRMEMRREEAGQSEPPPEGELSEGDLVNRYGKGFALLSGMGFESGLGLGASGQGRVVPVDVSSAAQTTGRHQGLGFGSEAV